jgi:predicted phage terminase large subunit-like protein
MQKPSAEGGNIVKESWFRKISLADFTALRYNETMHFFVDTAYDEKKKKTDNDPTGILAACMIGANIYIYNAMQIWKTFPDLIRFLPEYMSANLASAHSSLRIEPKANGISVVQTLEAISSLNVTRTPSPTDSKAERLHAVSPTIECGRVWIVEGDWNDEFVSQVSGFPQMTHDEFVDILGYAINYFKNDDFVMPKNLNNLF